jgi:replicative superfamily II helicase
MPPVIKLTDQNELVPTKNFPDYAHFPFEHFNPVQSRIFEIYDKDANAIIAAATAAGKTICAEQFMSHEVRVRGGKALYLVPLKALAKEKIDDWTDKAHHFGDLKLSICTGDYRLTAARKKELEKADIIVMTSEMLCSRVRNYKSEQNEFLKDIGTLVSDEVHLLTVPGRGDHLEVGLMKFTQLNKKVRIVGLSATIPNVKEISEWVSYTLTGRETYLIDSSFRPCELGVHWEEYKDGFRYETNEECKIESALDVVLDYPDDKFLVFVHTKRTGEKMKKVLQDQGIKCEFHNADLEKDKRQALEKRFKENQDLRVLVATSTLAWGINCPARRVVITGVHRGIQEVEWYDIWQEAGRAGRPGYDPRGDVYILLPKKKFDHHFERLKEPLDIESRLLDYYGEDKKHYKTLAFHLVSEIHHGNVKTIDDIHKWFERSLAYFQNRDLSEDIVDDTMSLLERFGAVKRKGDEYEVTAVGKISSMFYYSPFDVADLKRNFNHIFESNYDNYDLAVSMALGNVDSIRMGFVSKAEEAEMYSYFNKITDNYGTGKFMDTAIKGGYAHFLLMNGLSPGPFAAMVRGLQFDFPRTVAVLQALDSMAGQWGRRAFLEALSLRITYGVRADLVVFCTLPNVGKVRAEKLHAAGFRSLKDIVDRPDHVQKVLNMKQERVDEIVSSAKTSILTGK